MADMEKVYQEKFDRYMTAMDCGKPDKVPIRFGVGEWIAKYKDCTLQEIFYDINKATKITNETLAELDIDILKGGPTAWYPQMFDAMGSGSAGRP